MILRDGGREGQVFGENSEMRSEWSEWNEWNLSTGAET